MPYTEDELIEQPAINLFSDIDSQTLNFYSEIFGEKGIVGRENCSGVISISTGL